MIAISQSLIIFECEDNFLENIDSIEHLYNLQQLKLKDN